MIRLTGKPADIAPTGGSRDGSLTQGSMRYASSDYRSVLPRSEYILTLMLIEIQVSRMVDSPVRAYSALLVVVAAAISGTIIFSGFVAIDFVLDTITVWGYIAAVGVMTICATVSWLTDLSGILSNEFG